MELSGMVEISVRKKFLAVGEACIAVFRPTSDFNGKHSTLGSQHKEDLNFCVHST